MVNKTKYLKYGLHIAILIGLIWAFVKYVNGQEVLKALQNFAYVYLPIMVALSLIYFVFKGIRFVLLMNPFIEKIKKSIIFKGYIAGQPATLLPGGIAARAGMMKQIGIPISQSSVPVAVQSGWDQAIFLLGGLITALWFPAARTPVLIILAVLAVVGTLLIIPKSRHWFADLAQKLAKRFDYEEEWQRFLDAIPTVFTKKIVVGCFLITIVAFGLQIALLGMTMRGLELDVPLPTLFLAFIVPTMLGRIFPVPGGIGITEASMVGFLTATAQLNTETTVAAVAIYRIVAIVLTAAVGAIVYFLFWKGEEEVQAEQTSSEEGDEDTSVAAAIHN